MKRLLVLTVLFLAAAFMMHASVVVNGVDINKLPDVKYCQLLSKGKLLSTKVTIVVDYGQKVKLFSKEQKIKDGNGKSMKFYSPIHALNFMSANGWELIDSYFLTLDGMLSKKQNVLHFLLRKREDNGAKDEAAPKAEEPAEEK